jgi:hypothetical protein
MAVLIFTRAVLTHLKARVRATAAPELVLSWPILRFVATITGLAQTRHFVTVPHVHPTPRAIA